MLISKSRSSCFDIDVFLEPFMKDMKLLWKKRVKIIDVSLKKKFNLKGIIFVTITNYLGLFSLSEHVEGKTDFVVCLMVPTKLTLRDPIRW